MPPRAPLSAAVGAKIGKMAPLFDGKTLAGWIQAPITSANIGREEVLDFPALARRLGAKSDPMSAFLADQLDDAGNAALAAALAGSTEPRTTISPVLRNINRLIGAGASLYDAERFKDITLRDKTASLRQKNPSGFELARLNRLLLEDVYDRELAKSPDAAWVVKDGVMASTGAGRGVIYTDKDYAHYRIVFQVRQSSGNHVPGVLIFCQRPPAGEPGLDALGGIQFQVPNGGHWDYRPGMNNGGTSFTRPIQIRFKSDEWAQVEIVVNAKTGIARMAVAQPVGTRAIENLSFNDPAAGRPGPFALQMHNARLFDEYKELRIEVDPKDDNLITAE
jgi:hypothetical protein